MAILIFFSTSINAQFFETGQDPSSIKWRQINTQFFKLVYDSSFETQAQHFASILEYCDTLSGMTLSQKPEKISILIHNHSALSNGLVVWAPKRMEIYPVSPQDIYPQDWFDQLGLHENRHVSQISRTRRGLTSALNFVFGQQAQGIVITYMHSWFLEGDAVTTETALSSSGRGREPSFEMETRAYMMDTHKPYSFKKAVMGSFRDEVPDPYQLGYLMVAYNRAKYGTKIWENVLDYAGRNPFTLFPFYFSLKKTTGLSRTKLYEKTFRDLDSAWSHNSKELIYSDIHTINIRTSNVYTSYRNPCFYNDSEIIAEKSGIDDVKKFVKINTYTKKEKVIFVPGIISSDNLSLAGKYLVWAEIVPDLRWENESYSVIRRLDLISGKSKYLTGKTKYFAPVISPDGLLIAAVETNIKGQNSIVLISSDKGEEINKFPTPGNCAVQLPSWDDSSRFLVMTAVNHKGKGLLMLDTKTGFWQTFLEPSYTNISQPRFLNNYIVYQSGYSGIENLYVIHRTNRKIFQITSVHYGAFDPNIKANRQNIVFSNYTSHGYDVALLSFDSAKWIPKENIKDISLDLSGKISSQETEKFDPGKIRNKAYVSKPYSKFSNLFYVHSWMPFYTDLTITRSIYSAVWPGYMLFSQNLQGTLIAYGGQAIVNNKVYSNLSFSYKAMFPVFQVSVSDYNGLGFTSAAYIPFNLSRGKYMQSFLPAIIYSLERYSYVDPVSHLRKSNLSRFAYSIAINRFYNSTQKDIFPKFGESISAYFSNPLASQTDVSGNYWNIISNIYFPGLFNHNGIKLSFAIEKQTIKKFILASSLLPNRGFNNVWNVDTNKFSSLTTLSFDYAFPVLFPDLQILKIIYLKRVNADLYIENTNGKLIKANSNLMSNFTSTGIEITGDYNLFYIPVLINMGIRVAYRPKLYQSVTEFIWRINLNSF
jgi:hypothetical protein